MIRKTLRSIALVLAAAGFASQSLAQDDSGTTTLPAVPPKVSNVCKGGKVDRTALLTYLLEYDPAISSDEAERDLADPALLAAAGSQHTSLIEAQLVVQDMLNLKYKQNFPGVSPAGPHTSFGYFALNSTIEIACTEAKPATSSWLQRIRVRGVPGDLVYGADAQSGTSTDVGTNSTPGQGAYATASKASASLSDNGLTKTATYQLQAALGFAIEIDPSDSSNVLIPYIATNWNQSTTRGKPTKISTQTVSFGTDLGLDDTPFGIPSRFNFEPDYLMNLLDNSRLVSGHVSWMPYGAGFLNNPGNLCFVVGPCSETQDLGSSSWPDFDLIADLRSDGGVYADRGNNLIANRDFVRLGSEFGFGFWLNKQFNLTVVNTYMYGFSGARRTLNDFDPSLTFYFGQQNNLGLTVAYKNGLLEQTAQREQSWTIGLTAKF